MSFDANEEQRALPPVRQRTRPQPPQEPADEAADNDAASPPPAGDYEVGYRKPPEHSRFKPGLSGNPRGRPRAAKSMKTIVRDTLTQKVTVRTAAGQMRMSRMEAVLHKTIELAMKGNARASGQLVSLYSAAVPDQVQSGRTEAQEDLTAADLRILEAMREDILAGRKD